MNPDTIGPTTDDGLGPSQQPQTIPTDDGLGPTPQPASTPDPDTSAMKQFVANNLKDHNPKEGKTYADGFGDSLLAGLQMSSTGLLVHGAPTTILPEHAGRAMRIASQAGQFIGDVPEFIIGGVGGLAATGGNPIGAGAGAFAVPAALRKILMDHYEKGDISSASDFVDRLMGTAWEATKGALTGAATAATGGAVGPVLGSVAGAAAELGTMTTVGAALEGRLPTLDEFIDGAVIIGGLHGVTHIAPKLRNIYAKTGEHPSDVVDAASKDVQLKQDLISPDPNFPKIAEPTELSYAKEASKEEGGSPETLKVDLIPRPEKEIPESKFDRTPEEKEILSKIGVSAEKLEPSMRQKYDAFYAKNIDYLDPIKSALKEAKENGAEISAEDDPYQMGRRFAAHSDTIRAVLEFGTRDAKTNEINGEGLNQIYRDIPNGDLNGYRAYGIAKRALELEARGITPYEGYNKEVAQKVVSDGASKFEEINRRRIEFQNKVLDFAQGKGLYSADSIESMKELNKEHFAFNRAQEADLYTGKVRGGSAVKRIFGSEKGILDPVLQTLKNTEMIIKKAMINDVRSSFVESMAKGGLLDVEGDPKENSYLTRLSKGMRPVEVQAEEISRELKKQGFEGVDPKSFVIFRPENTYLKENQVMIMENGKPQIYEGPPGVIDSLKRLEGDQTAIDTWGKIMRTFATTTRVGVVANPGFGFSHFFRSQVMASVNSKTGMIPFLDSALAVKELMGKSSKDYQDWLYHGGASSSWFRIEDNYLKDNAIERDEKQAPIHGRAWNAIHSGMEATEAFIKITDNAARFAEFKRLRERGKSPQEAAFGSREVVPDYQKVGLQRSALRTGVAFIGAHINSLDRMKQAFVEDPKSTIAKLSAITAVSAMLWVVNKDDPAIEALPDWQKDQYWNFNITRFSGKKGEPATIVRLPKPWAPGILFGSGVEAALDQFSKEHPKRAEHFTQTLFHSVIPEPIPNIAQPILEQWANKNKFTGRALVRDDLEKQLPEMQYAPYTSEAAKQIAKIIGYVPLVRDIGPEGINVKLQSPLVVENYIHAWGGTAGGWALNIADKLIRQEQKNQVMKSNLSASEKQTKLAALSVDRADPWQNTPVLHSWVSRYPNYSDQAIQDFRENKSEADRVLNSIRAAAKKGDIDAIQRIYKIHPDFEPKLESISKGLSTASKTFGIIRDDPKMPAVEKRQLLDTLLFQMSSMARHGNDLFYEFKKSSHGTMTQGE